jgi:lysozyme
VQISPNGIAFIEANEGFSATVYNDTAGNATIGYGHKLEVGESFPNPITQEEAQQLLLGDLALVELTLAQLVPPSCTQSQFDALCDFGFNLGCVALKTMLGHGWEFVPLQIPRWDFEKVNGVEQQSPALEARRQREVALFNS